MASSCLTTVDNDFTRALDSDEDMDLAGSGIRNLRADATTKELVKLASSMSTYVAYCHTTDWLNSWLVLSIMLSRVLQTSTKLARR